MSDDYPLEADSRATASRREPELIEEATRSLQPHPTSTSPYVFCHRVRICHNARSISVREISEFGPDSTAPASFFATSSKSRSRIRLATWKLGNPAWRVPKNSPGP